MSPRRPLFSVPERPAFAARFPSARSASDPALAAPLPPPRPGRPRPRRPLPFASPPGPPVSRPRASGPPCASFENGPRRGGLPAPCPEGSPPYWICRIALQASSRARRPAARPVVSPDRSDAGYDAASFSGHAPRLANTVQKSAPSPERAQPFRCRSKRGRRVPHYGPHCGPLRACGVSPAFALFPFSFWRGAGGRLHHLPNRSRYRTFSVARRILKQCGSVDLQLLG